MNKPTDTEFREMLEKNVDSKIYCTFLHDADENESSWFDCTHPQKPAIVCPYKKMSECTLAVPDKVQQDMHIESAMVAKHFWDNFRKDDDKKLHICDFSIDQLKNMHMHVLQLIPKYDPVIIGLLIAGKYYRDVWASRSCSGNLAELVGTNDYLDFYCSSPVYYTIITLCNPIVAEFEKADALDH